MDEGRLKQKVQTVIVSCSVILMTGKFIAFFMTNSVGILTDAMESIVNVAAGFIGLYSLHLAAKPFRSWENRTYFSFYRRSPHYSRRGINRF